MQYANCECVREIILVCFEGAGRTDGVRKSGHLQEVAQAAAELSLLTSSQSLPLDKRKVAGKLTESEKS